MPSWGADMGASGAAPARLLVLVMSLVLVGCGGPHPAETSGAAATRADADHDGVDDRRDRCPGTAQIKRVDPAWQYAVVVSEERLSPTPRSYPVDADGCELDGDGDRVVNSADYCPEDSPAALAAGVAPNGCPTQSDGDGTPDYRDDCPGTPRGVRADNRGCPI